MLIRIGFRWIAWPGNPPRSALINSFDGSLRDALLSGDVFNTLSDAC